MGNSQIDIDAAYNRQMPFILGVDRAAELNKLKTQAKTDKTLLDKFSEEMNQVLDEQIEYVVEIEDMQQEFESLQETYEQNMTSSQERYLVLYEKAFNGSITEEEQQELNSLEAERNGLSAEYNQNAQNITASITSVKQSYGSIGDKTANLNSVIAGANETINGLTEWNENNNSETGKKIYKLFNQSNDIVITVLSGKVEPIEQPNKDYTKYSNFLKN